MLRTHLSSKQRSLGLLACAALLTACQSNNPYQAQSAPLPAEPQGIQRIDGPYPAAPLSFSSYRSWSWQVRPAATASLSSEEIQAIIADALEQHGLRPSGEQAQPDLKLKASVRQEKRVRQVYDDYGTYYGQGRYDRDYGAWGRAPVARNYEENVLVIYLELLDAHSGQSVWSNQAEARSSDKSMERQEALRDAARQALADYPPG
ncbi:DUF4136 domain-containing protein [Pseudomonas sp. ABC1]|uniref:DUF4136 domain-containing protein n=1 Tax=Pseudomonas sp. ABC1 TaxID=2748080 RepID=UPI0015C3E8FF|nr:DUF4136 domain-containing protein [Pseudomonas sp. ABC1]QLF92334.1 DUF4136 domain-containing protein [Pseudomonas sp. ABC1]